jgi:hypothetical protein
MRLKPHSKRARAISGCYFRFCYSRFGSDGVQTLVWPGSPKLKFGLQPKRFNLKYLAQDDASGSPHHLAHKLAQILGAV